MSSPILSLPPLQPFVDGAFRCDSEATFETRDPAHDTLIAEVAEATEADVDAAVTAAWAAYRGAWGTLSLDDRARMLRRIAAGIDERREALATLEAVDAGKPLRQCRAIVDDCVEQFLWFSDVAQKLRGYAHPSDSHTHSYSTVEPVGVVAGITPWNSPLKMAVGKAAPALAMGNSFVLKPAEQAPLTALALAEICAEAGLPGGAFSVLPGGPRIGAALVGDERVPLVSFTGSTEVGHRIAAGAAPRLQRIILELGGKSPVIVFDDAVSEAMVDAVVLGFTWEAGQVCFASTRLITQPKTHDDVLALIAERTRQLSLGDPLDPNTRIGPLISADQLERVAGYVQEGRDTAEVLVGGERPRIPGLENGFFYAPTVIDGLSPSSRLVREEVFGPVLCVTPATSEDEAVALANDSAYGLAAFLWTNDLSRAHRVARRLEAGSIEVNSFGSAFPYGASFGGWKQSGVGVESGLEGALAFTRSKVISIALT